MCGIAGFLAPGGTPPAPELLRQMSETMVHRGPDDSGTALAAGGRVGLAHRRLSVIDLTAAASQPMATEDGLHLISFNGEVYNFRELREELRGRGCRFRSDSDTEVVLCACRQWGVREAASRFIGMFAFAFWDGASGRLSLVRDRLGIKPLYLARLPGLTLFASELKPLLSCPGFSREVDRRALQYYLEFQYVPAPHAIFRDTRKVMPGEIIEIDLDGKEAAHRYWDIAHFWTRAEDDRRSEGECREEFTALLRSAVRYRLISDVPLGAFLSGGIDSSLTVALMQQESTLPVHTFSIGFQQRGYDESRFAREVAGHLGTEHQEKVCTAADALELVRKIPDAYDEPFADSSAIPTMLLSEFTRRQVTVSLSGDGGDELFCGYPRYDWLRRGTSVRAILGPLRRPLCLLLGRIPVHKMQRAAESLLQDDAAQLYFHTVGIFERRRLAEVLPEVCDDAGLAFFRIFSDPRWGRIVERAMLADIKTYLVDDILTKVDRASMAYSLEARVPLLDHRIVEFAAGLPLEWKLRGNTKKYLMRRVLHTLVPARLVERPKMGFGIPVNRWLRRELRSLTEEYLNPARIGREGFFRPEGVARLVREHLSGSRDHQYRLWALLVFCLWRERYRAR